MQLHSFSFIGNRPAEYRRLAGVLSLSAAENSPATPLVIHEISAVDRDIYQLAERRHCAISYLDNTRKTRHQTDFILSQPDGELVGLLDLDTMVVGDLSPIEYREFDFAYTVRPDDCRFRLNSGVLFVRVNRLTRAWFRQWLEINLQMLEDERFHTKWRTQERCGGINQAALGWLLAHQGDGVRRLKTLELPCAEWNSTSSMWGNPGARVVHIMSQLREWCFGRSICRDPLVKPVITQWQQYDARVREARAARQQGVSA